MLPWVTLPLRRMFGTPWVGGVGLPGCSAGVGIGRVQRMLGVMYARIPHWPSHHHAAISSPKTTETVHQGSCFRLCHVSAFLS